VIAVALFIDWDVVGTARRRRRKRGMLGSHDWRIQADLWTLEERAPR